MKKNRTKLVITVFVLGFFLVATWSTGLLSKSQRDFYASVSRNIKIFGNVYKQTANHYVEEVDPEKFMRAGINGMLDELDPQLDKAIEVLLDLVD